MNARAKQGHVDLVYIGDSIVGSWKWDGEPRRNHYYAKRNGVVLGISGDRTEQALWRLQNGNVDGISPKLAIVMIGQNNGPFNTGEEIGAGVTAIVNTLREKLPTTKILVLAIFPRGEKPTPERAVLATANGIASKLADGKAGVLPGRQPPVPAAGRDHSGVPDARLRAPQRGRAPRLGGGHRSEGRGTDGRHADARDAGA